MLHRWRIAALAVSLLAAGALPSACTSAATPAQRVATLTLLFFVLGFVLNVVECWLFSSRPLPIRAVHFVGALALSAVAATAVALLVADHGGGASWPDQFAARFGDRSLPALLLQLGGAAAVYVGVQGVVGSSFWPFVRRFYDDSAAGLDLRIPSPRVMLPFQLARGGVGIAALLPWLTLIRLDGWLDRAAFGLTLVVTMGVVPLLGAERWPPRLRMIHAIEITLIALLWSLAIGWIVSPRDAAA